MAGEHLPLSNYDDLSVAEIKTKIGVLIDANTSFDVDAVVEYERDGQNRQGIITFLEHVAKEGVVMPPSGETPTTGHEGEDKQSGTQAGGKSPSGKESGSK